MDKQTRSTLSIILALQLLAQVADAAPKYPFRHQEEHSFTEEVVQEQLTNQSVPIETAESSPDELEQMAQTTTVEPSLALENGSVFLSANSTGLLETNSNASLATNGTANRTSSLIAREDFVDSDFTYRQELERLGQESAAQNRRNYVDDDMDMETILRLIEQSATTTTTTTTTTPAPMVIHGQTIQGHLSSFAHDAFVSAVVGSEAEAELQRLAVELQEEENQRKAEKRAELESDHVKATIREFEGCDSCPTDHYKDLDLSLAEDCPVCLLPIVDNDNLLLDCNHNFHILCLWNWKRLAMEPQCPICRRKFKL